MVNLSRMEHGCLATAQQMPSPFKRRLHENKSHCLQAGQAGRPATQRPYSKGSALRLAFHQSDFRVRRQTLKAKNKKTKNILTQQLITRMEKMAS